MLESPIGLRTLAVVAGALTGLALASPPAAAQNALLAKAGGVKVAQSDAVGIETATDAVGAEQSEAGLTLRSEGSELVLEFSGTSRRKVVERLFAASGAVVSWNDEAHAAEMIKGRITGSLDEVMATLLPHGNYVIVHRTIGDELRIVSVLILGPSLQSPDERPPQVVASVRASTNAHNKPPNEVFRQFMKEARRPQE